MSISTLLVLAARRLRPIQLDLNLRAVDIDKTNFAGLTVQVKLYDVFSAGNDPAGDCVTLT
jgi:hypothetical protein